ncbi:MAG: hypothetical protein IIZ39_12410 [Blautia sp.]|nr:hypothetical protein [Blautia sp.]
MARRKESPSLNEEAFDPRGMEKLIMGLRVKFSQLNHSVSTSWCSPALSSKQRTAGLRGGARLNASLLEIGFLSEDPFRAVPFV